MDDGRWWEGMGIILQTRADVWTPTYFARIFLRLTEQLVIRQMRETGHCRVLDFGCGSGILGISAAGLGAIVTATDLNPAAVELTIRNADLNGVGVDVREGDRFSAIRGGEKYDLIIANTPSIPGRTGSGRQTAEEWNENGDGRLLLDSVLTDGPLHLHQGGRLLTANNSEQGMDTTLRHLNSRWNGHHVLRHCSFELDLDQFKAHTRDWVRRGLARELDGRFIHYVHFIEAWV